MLDSLKHTPGPWTDKAGSAGTVWAGNEFIASVYPNAQPGWDGYGRFDRQDETEANARLIAAAPDLLEALWEAKGLADMAEMQDGPGEPSPDQAILIALRSKIDAAIAKAVGQLA